MDVSELIRSRLEETGREQKDLARAAGVTDSYVSQLLARRKSPPSPRRSSIYRRMDRFLGLPDGRLAELAEAQRLAELRRVVADPPAPLLPHLRELLLARCRPSRREAVRGVFAGAPFGELERLVARVLLEVVESIVRPRLDDEDWLRRLGNRSGETALAVRALAQALPGTGALRLSARHCEVLLAPLIAEWDVELLTLAVEVTPDRRLAGGRPRRFAPAEQARVVADEEPGFRAFVRDKSLSGSASPEELAMLRALRFEGRHPTALYYYRELQSRRDPLHFDATAKG